MNLKQFNQIRRDYNRIPLVREVFADLDTPLSTYLKLADEPYTYLFESVQGGEKWGRYSIIGMACDTRLEVHGKQVRVESNGVTVSDEHSDDPLAFIEAYLQQFKVAEADCLPKFHGGLGGLFRLRHDSLHRTQTRCLPQPGQASDPGHPVDVERPAGGVR